ncbi:MAG TPA: hypothetical protein VHP36_01310 [Chitinispirillaceae bacterium]|nr:hypothetical protein [Chitinispirillaceae bacterium]
MKSSLLRFIPIALFLFSFAANSAPRALFKTSSQKRLVETARDHQWSINFHKSKPDTIHIMAFMVEFKPDTLHLTTGNGRFEMRGGGNKEKDEFRWYLNSKDTVYKFDHFPHDSLYFVYQLETAAQYFHKVSRGKLILKHSVYSTNSDGKPFTVPDSLPKYSPGGKRKGETQENYYERKSTGLLRFSKDALLEVSKGPGQTPFSTLSFNPADSTIRDESGVKTVFLIFHAGATYFTDSRQDSEGDMYDVFITPNYYKYYKDSLNLTQNGILVQGKNPLLINEVMICSETANQDSLNCGIQGILVNQIARQLGIPDLWSSSGSGVGGFCIMDIGADFNGNGFIPPYPSAWVRAFMGWDEPKIAPIGAASSHSVKALSSVLNKVASGQQSNDTTILMVPINEHEYYLIENRQRNLSGDTNFFNYDTSDHIRKPISSYPFHVNFDSVLTQTTGPSNTIVLPKNNDIGIPASGMVVWHVDEHLIRQRLQYNMLNNDSTYKAVSLVEADGVPDISIKFQNILGEQVYDFGGAEDVFPFEAIIDSSSTIISVNKFGPYTSPNTRGNDGGHSWIKLQFTPRSSIQRERSVMMKGSHHHYVSNISDSIFTVNVQWDYLVPSWPKRAAPEDFFEPVSGNFDTSSQTQELVLVSKSGKIYAWSADTTPNAVYNRKKFPINRVDLKGDTLYNSDTISFLDSLSKIIAMPSVIANRVFMPSGNGCIYSLSSLKTSVSLFDTIRLSAIPSSYVCNYKDSAWAVGCKNGVLIFGKFMNVLNQVKLKSDSSVNAVASMNGSIHSIASIQNDGTLSLCTAGKSTYDLFTVVPGIGPYTLVTADLDRDSAVEIVVSDSRHGLWVYKSDLKLAKGWSAKPTDWPSNYTYIDTRKHSADDRSLYPVNYSSPALSDLDRDGYLDIVTSGTNGIYAFNYKNALLSGWPAYLDTRYWYQRGSIQTSPAIVTGANREPLVLFSSTNGENITFRAAKVVKADVNSGTVWFYLENGALDSITDFTKAQMDTILNYNDSLISHDITPGGLIDALTKDANRPSNKDNNSIFQSSWPQTAGSPLLCSPMLCFLDPDQTPDLIAVSTEGWIYRWELEKKILPDSLFWPMPGFNAGRSFNYGGTTPPILITQREPICFFSYPNPARGIKKVSFKYQFSGPATNVKLDIFSITGFVVYSKKTMGNPPEDLSGSYPSWNEHNVSIEKFGPGVYRCRLEATINGKKHSRFWKLAVIK